MMRRTEMKHPRRGIDGTACSLLHLSLRTAISGKSQTSTALPMIKCQCQPGPFGGGREKFTSAIFIICILSWEGKEGVISSC